MAILAVETFEDDLVLRRERTGFSDIECICATMKMTGSVQIISHYGKYGIKYGYHY